MSKILRSSFPAILIVLSILAFFSPVIFFHKLPLPADTIPALHHPIKDALYNTYPNGPPFKNFLITDSIRQQFPWRQFSINQLKIGQIPWWNPYNFSGTPHLANFQSASFYPLNLIFWFVDFTTGWSLLVVSQQFLGGLFLYLFLRNNKLSSLSSAFGSITWIFSGFFIAWLEWNTAVHVAVWTPLILLSINHLHPVSKNKPKANQTFIWATILLFSLVSQLFAGYPQPWIYLSFLQLGYLAFRYFQNAHSHKSLSPIVNTISIYVIAYAIGLLQLIPTLMFSQQSNRVLDQGGSQYNLLRADWFLPYQNLIQMIVPDFFGNPATLNYWGVFNYTEFVSFIGVIPFFMVLLACTARQKSKLTKFFLTALVISLIFALKNPLSTLQIQLNLPFLSSSQPSRWIVITDLSLSILAAVGLESFIHRRSGMKLSWTILFLVFVVLWIAVLLLPHLQAGLSLELNTSKRNLVLPTLEIVILSLMLLAQRFTPKASKSFMVLTLVLVITSSLSGLRFGRKFTPFSDPVFLYPPSSILTYLQSHQGVFRYATTDRRIMAPNINLPYKLYTIEGYDPLYLYDYGRLISAVDYTQVPPTPRAFNRAVLTDQISSPIIDLLGVKYVLSFEIIQDSSFQLVMEEGQTKLYQNMQVLPRAFLTQEADPFSLSLDNTVPADIISYLPNQVIVHTSSATPQMLILTDAYYPDWTVSTDNQPAELINWFGLRATIIPRGEHEIIYQYSYPQL